MIQCNTSFIAKHILKRTDFIYLNNIADTMGIYALKDKCHFCLLWKFLMEYILSNVNCIILQCIVEEVQGPVQARSRKGRFISG